MGDSFPLPCGRHPSTGPPLGAVVVVPVLRTRGGAECAFPARTHYRWSPLLAEEQSTLDDLAHAFGISREVSARSSSVRWSAWDRAVRTPSGSWGCFSKRVLEAEYEKPLTGCW